MHWEQLTFPSSSRRALYTVANAPSPSLLSNVYPGGRVTRGEGVCELILDGRAADIAGGSRGVVERWYSRILEFCVALNERLCGLLRICVFW
jgi:hypothetical protein